MKKKWILLHMAMMMVLACAAVKFADELVIFKQGLYECIQQFLPEKEAELILAYEDYAPMTHPEDAWYQKERMVFHAGGEIDGLTYTNSREALEATLSRGSNVVEMDFLYTSDGQLVCVHEWKDVYAVEPITKEEIWDVGIFRKYTPMTAEEFLDYMREYPEMMLVIDTKEEDEVKVIAELVRLAGEDKQILDRFIIQCYDRGMKQAALEVYPFKNENFLFTVYKFGRDRAEEVLQICYEEDIRVVTVTMWYWPDEIIDLFCAKNIRLYEHCHNDTDSALDAFDRGVYGIYTDFLLPSELEEARAAREAEG